MSMKDGDWASYLNDVKPEQREWLWHGRIPLGELTLIAGIQGVGKSLLVTDVVSRITTGRKWPDKTHCPEGTVILLPAEDNLATTVRPRYDAAKADLTKIIIVKGVLDKKKELIAFDLGRDIPYLTYLLEHSFQPRAIVIDPLGSYVGNIDTNRENQVRNVLYALRIELAEKHNVAIIGIVHLRKGGIEDSALSRILGSVAFTASARTVWGIAQDTDDPERRLLVPIKFNLAARSLTGFEFFIKSAPNGQGIIHWGDEIQELAEEIMYDHGMKPEKQRDRAKKIILDALKSGPQPASEVTEMIIKEGISLRTIKSAKKELGIRSVKSSGPESKWIWYLSGRK